MQIFVRHFHDIRKPDHSVNAGAIRRFVSDKAGADVGVDHGDPCRSFARHQCLISRAAGVDDKRYAAKEHRLDIIWQGGQLVGADHPASGVFIIKCVRCLTVYQLDEGKRGRAIQGDRQIAADIAVGERCGQHFAEKVR